MDFNSILHAYNKIMADRATSNTTVRSDNQHDTPPAYSTLTTAPPTADSDMGSDTDSEVEDDNPGQTITINASTIIQGSNNIIAVPPIDGPRLTSILLSLLHGTLPTQIQAQQQQQQQQREQLAAHGTSPAGTAAPQQHLPGHLPGDDSSKRPLPSIRIDCGMRIVGDRNVVGALPPSLRAGAATGGTVSPAGAAIQQQQQSGGGTMTRRGDGGRDEVSAGGMPTPPETPLSLTGGEAGSKKRKAGENEAETEAETGGREAKRERVDGAEERV
ncbi:hypothetical protein SLS54_003506 [Diplodia seriata]